MIAKLKGIVDAIEDGFAIIDVHGVGYRVFASSKTLARLVVGEATTLYIETIVREDAIHLHGFADSDEKRWFGILTTVQGVGVKVAQAILSVLNPSEIQLAIAAGDAKALARANGVGAKLAARIVVELKDKAGSILPVSTALPSSKTDNNQHKASAVDDAISALVNLGYQRMEAVSTVANIAKDMGNDATAQNLIRAALKELGNK